MPYDFVDIAIIVILAGFALIGLRRGFLAGASDIVAMVVAFLFAVRGYAAVSGWLAQAISLPQIMVNFIALIGLFIVAAWVLGIIIGVMLGVVQRLLLPGPLRWIDSLLGALPGLVKGLLIATSLVTLFTLFPINQDLRAQIQNSTIGRRLAAQASQAAPSLESLFGGSPHDTALFITQPTQDESPRKMNFPANIGLREDVPAEERMLVLVNEERVRVGLKPLVYDSHLRSVALAHSGDMFRQSYFAHESPNGDNPADRLRKDRVAFSAMGENLAYAPSVDVAHTGLMNSPGHRANILSPQFGRIGIGVMDGGLYGKMFSQEFTN